MRGIVSLAAALALPVAAGRGTAFPFRDEVILLTFAVILSTLVIQGLSLTPLIRRLELGEDDSLEVEEAFAREEAARAALARLETLAGGAWPRQDLERLRALYTQRVQRASPLDLGDGSDTARARAASRRLRQEMLAAERKALIALRDRGVISDEILHRLENELDIEAVRLGLGEARTSG
jgi:CPA1 family monovalent cation:H+ antiporter